MKEEKDEEYKKDKQVETDLFLQAKKIALQTMKINKE